MKLVLLSDSHMYHNDIVVPDGDMVIHAGDYSHVGSYMEVMKFLYWFSNLPHRYKIFINGNHEKGFWKNPYLFEQEIPKNLIYLYDDKVTIEGLKIYGTPHSREFFGWGFPYFDDEEATKLWKRIPDDTDILISHQPPYGINDITGYKREGEDPHVGCKPLLKRVAEVKPKLHVFGHIHFDRGWTRPSNPKFAETLFVNAANCDEAYSPVNPPIVVDTETWSVINED